MLVRAKKSLGQNFLRDERVVEQLVMAAELRSGDVVLEPGAGAGIVTREIAKHAQKVYAVEFDRDLIPELEKNVPNNVEVINKDTLDLDPLNFDPPPSVILGSIPYQITSPLIHKIVYWIHRNLAGYGGSRIKRAVLLIQKEVAHKITAQSPKATYLSSLIALFGRAEIVQTVPPEAFWPRPKVMSAILKIEIGELADWLTSELADQRISELDKFEKFLHHGFRHPRKMLNKVFNKEVLEACGIDPTNRPGNLTPKQWLNLYHKTVNSGSSK